MPRHRQILEQPKPGVNDERKCRRQTEESQMVHNSSSRIDAILAEAGSQAKECAIRDA